MFFHRTAVRLTAAALCLTLAGASVSADGGEAPVFAPGVTGICVTALPESGTVCLGNRVIRRGDVLTAEQAASLTLSHPETEEDARAVMEYLPMGPEGLGLVCGQHIAPADDPAAEPHGPLLRHCGDADARQVPGKHGGVAPVGRCGYPQ